MQEGSPVQPGSYTDQIPALWVEKERLISGLAQSQRFLFDIRPINEEVCRKMTDADKKEWKVFHDRL